MAERRRLPVIQPPKEKPGGDEEPRPPWHWVGFGTVAIFACWLVLATLAGALVRRALVPYLGAGDLTPEELGAKIARLSSDERTRVVAIQMVPHAFALALASFGGGFLVGRFGSGTGAREGAASGAATAIIATLLAWHEGGVSWASAVTVVIAVVFAGWGGKSGAARKT